MITKTYIFCQIMLEKNEVKDANPLKTSVSFASKTV